MEQKAFALIQEKLQEALSEQGFRPAEPLETENGTAVLFSTGEVGYALFYEEKTKRFVLRSTMMKTEKEPGDFRDLSVWLFDGAENTMAAARTRKTMPIRSFSSTGSWRFSRSSRKR